MNMEQRLQSLELQSSLTSQKVVDIQAKVEEMPTRDETKLMFIEETRKLIDGFGARINKIEGNQKYVVGFGAGVGVVINYIIHLFK